MALKNHSDLLSQLGRRESEIPSDADLVHRFIACRDEEAFAAIVRRHGGMVWGICQRVTGHYHLAEDAFQAVFMVLAAKAGSIRPASVLPGWLHAVACRTALRARTMADRRRRRESATVPDSTSPRLDPMEMTEVAAILDEEIAALSEKLRAAVVLCELQGRSRKQAAEQLGISEGTVSSRLALARKTLAGRLKKRGIAFSIASMTLGNAAIASVPSGLAERAIAAAISPGAVSTQITLLSNGVLRTMFILKLKRILFVLALVLPTVLGGVLIASELATDSPPVAQQQFAFADPPKSSPDTQTDAKKADPLPQAKTEAKGLGRLMILRRESGKNAGSKLVFLSPDGKELADDSAKHPEEYTTLTFPTVSPDGKRVAFIANQLSKGGPGTFQRHVFIRSLTDRDESSKIDVTAQNITWISDKKLLVTEVGSSKELRERDFANWLVDVEKKTKTRIEVPASTQLFGLTPDGKSYLAITYQVMEKTQQLSLIDCESKKVTQLTDVHWGPLPTVAMLEIAGANPKLSSDGNRIVFQDVDLKEELGTDKRHFPRLFIYDMKTKKRSRLADVPLNGVIMGYSWSPDSQKVAYVWKRLEADAPVVGNIDKNGKVDPKVLIETETHVIVAQADGTKPTTILTVKEKTSADRPILDLDWR